MRAATVAVAGLLAIAAPVAAQTELPATFDTLGEGFETATLENWVLEAGAHLALTAGSGFADSVGLEVAVSGAESHLRADDVARADEAYLTFWLDLNDVALNDPGVGWPPDRAIEVAAILGPAGNRVVALRVRQAVAGYEAFLEWRDAAGQDQSDLGGAFPVANGWQKLTLGFRAGEWIGCWIGDLSVRSLPVDGHLAPYGSAIEIGKTRPNALISPTGTLLFDLVRLRLPRIDALWVDADVGDDANDGRTPGTALETVSRAAALAGAGTTVHVSPGIYREAVRPAQGGLAGEPAIFRANGPLGSVKLRGSEAASTLTWTRLTDDPIGLPPGVDPASIWWTDLSDWQLTKPPRFVVRLGADQEVAERLPIAREPDWTIFDPSRPSAGWWVADGGRFPAQCDPGSDPDPECDESSRSETKLTDVTDDAWEPQVEVGNLTTLGNLVGGTLVARDNYRGSFHYRRPITIHQPAQGRITVEPACTRVAGAPGLGWGTEYYVEDHPALLDSPGEWWFDRDSERLYLWPPAPADPGTQDLEIARHNWAFDLSGRSWITLDGLDLELYNGNLVDNRNTETQSSTGITVVNSRLRWAREGVVLKQPIASSGHLDKSISGYRIIDNVMAHLDFMAIHATTFWGGGSPALQWTRPGLFDLEIRGNRIDDVGLFPMQGYENPSAVFIRHSDRVRIEDNHVSDLAHDGIAIGDSVVQSAEEWDFAPSEIQIGEILVRGNLIERACRIKNDCGALRFWGLPPDKHVFRDVLVIANTVRDTVGWSRMAEVRGFFPSSLPGADGSGIYLDNVSGLLLYRNVAYNNAWAGFKLVKTWRDGRVYLLNNIVADNQIGVRLGGLAQDVHPPVDTRVENNILVNNEAYGMLVTDLDDAFFNTRIDSNLYFANGWGTGGTFTILKPGPDPIFSTVEEIRAATSFELSGQAGDPGFLLYDPGDHNPLDGSWPDFRLRETSRAIDAGSASLPWALDDLLARFGLSDPPVGPAYDQGAFEGVGDCSGAQLRDQAITGDSRFESCGEVVLGPNVAVAATASWRVVAGESITLTEDVVLGGEVSMALPAEATP